MHEQTALGMWKSLEKLYQLKSLPNMIYLKKQFSCYKMEEDKSIEENVDIFLKLIAAGKSESYRNGRGSSYTVALRSPCCV